MTEPATTILPLIDRNATARTLFARMAQILRPKVRLNIWQWADKNRWLAKGVSAKARNGKVRYNSGQAPHQRQMQEAPLDPNVQCTVFLGASQIMGKTEVIGNVVGYHIHHAPTSQIVMYPTIEAAEKWSKKKFTPMIDASPCFDGLIRPARSRDSGNTILVKEFMGGSLFAIGANSATGLRAASGEMLIGDEIDSAEETKEGDPVELLFKRGESYPTCIKILSSTPTFPGAPIDAWFKLSDQRYWFVPCVKCGHRQTFKWKNVLWPPNEPQKTTYLCEKCAAALSDKDRLEMYFNGEWQPTAPFKGIAGFHLNMIYCPWPHQRGYTGRLHQMAVEHLRAVKKGRAAVKVWVNTGLAETFIDEVEAKPSWEVLFNRREDYGLEDEKPLLPAQVCLLTSAVDVQHDRLEVEVVGRGQEGETWGIEYRQIMGNVQLPSTWTALDDLLDRTFAHPSGASLRVATMCIDISDGQTSDAVKRFIKPRQARRVWAVKGSSTPNAPLIATAKIQKKSRIQIFTVGTDTAKATLYARLNILQHGPRFMHFPKGRGYDEAYFQGLVSESCRTEYKRGVQCRVWKKDRERNEPLDIRAYDLAGEEILNPNYKKLAKHVAMAAVDPAPKFVLLTQKPFPGKPGKPEQNPDFEKRQNCQPLTDEKKTTLANQPVTKPRSIPLAKLPTRKRWKISGW